MHKTTTISKVFTKSPMMTVILEPILEKSVKFFRVSYMCRSRFVQFTNTPNYSIVFIANLELL